MKPVVAVDLYGTLVERKTNGIIHPSVHKLIESLNNDIIICSAQDTRYSETICSSLGIPIAGAYKPGDIRHYEDIFSGALRAYEDTKKYMQGHDFNPIAYITDKNLDAILTAYAWGKALYYKSDIFHELHTDYIEHICDRLNISSRDLHRRIRSFDWETLTPNEINDINKFLVE